MRFTITRKLAIFIIIIAAATMLACGGSGGGTPLRTYVKFVNCAPDSSAGIDFLVNGVVVNTSAYLGDSAIQSRTPDDVDLSIRSVGSTEELDTIAQLFEADATYLVLATGLTSFSTEFSKRAIVAPVRIDRSRPSGNKARVIVVNALVGEADFPDPVIDFQDGNLPRFPFSDLNFGTHQSQVLDADSYAYEARFDNSDLAYATRTISFEAGKVYLVIIGGRVEATGSQAPQISVSELPPG
jgi:hypothetical protein